MSIDFYKELYASLDVSESDDEANICLISGSILLEDHVELECGHKFNYLPLLTEVDNQKNVLKTYKVYKYCEKSKKQIGLGNYISCPYCRNCQKTLLPEKNRKECKQVYGTNTLNLAYMTEYDIQNLIDYQFKLSHSTGKQCSATCKKSVFNEDGVKYFVIEPCKNNYIYDEPIDGNYYCRTHAIKTLRQLIKNAIKINEAEDMVLCQYILKSGANKGKPCNCKVFQDTNVCKRHSPKDKDKDNNIDSNN
jgi:hypothetical protein